jgi:hypothetical protein
MHTLFDKLVKAVVEGVFIGSEFDLASDVQRGFRAAVVPLLKLRTRGSITEAACEAEGYNESRNEPKVVKGGRLNRV